MAVASVVSGCGGGSSSPRTPAPPPPPPPTITNFSVMLTQLELTRGGDGAVVAVNGLPLNGNITVILTN